jgi:predicted RNA-binding protein YlxR (DUF448 family)
MTGKPPAARKRPAKGSLIMVAEDGTDVGAEGPETAFPDDDDPAKEKGPLRRCVATGTVQGKTLMLRFAVGPDGALVPDLEERLPGRGLWLSAEQSALALALRKGAFSRAARRAVRVPADLPAVLESLLTRRCLDKIGLARRAGQLVAGYEKVRDALRGGRVGKAGRPALLVEAADGSAEQRGKVTGLAPLLPVVRLFDTAALAAAVGRETAVHVVVAQGGLADGLLRDARRLAGLQGVTDGVSLGRSDPDRGTPDGGKGILSDTPQ